MRTEDWETLIWIHTLTNALSLRDSLAKVQVPNTRSQGSEDRRSIQLSYQGLLTSPACFGSLQVTKVGTTTGAECLARMGLRALSFLLLLTALGVVQPAKLVCLSTDPAQLHGADARAVNTDRTGTCYRHSFWRAPANPRHGDRRDAFLSGALMVCFSGH